MAPRKPATAPADKPADTLEFSDSATSTDVDPNTAVPEPGIVTEDVAEGAPDPGPVDPFGPGTADWPSPDYQPTYPVNEAGVPDPSTELYPGDDVEFLLDFLEHLAPEQFDRAKQRFMLAANEARA